MMEHLHIWDMQSLRVVDGIVHLRCLACGYEINKPLDDCPQAVLNMICRK